MTGVLEWKDTGFLGRTGKGDEEGMSPSMSMEHTEFCLGMEEELTKSLWVRIKGRAGTGDIIVGICYRPPNQEDRTDKTHYEQVGTASHS